MSTERRLNMFVRRTHAAALICLAGISSGWAHHSNAAFDMQKEGQITGRIEKFAWTNPHSYIYVVTAGANGKKERWRIESGSPSVMRAKGWEADSLKVGDVVTVDYRPSRDTTKHEGLINGIRTGTRQLPGLYSQGKPTSIVPAPAVAAGLAGVWVPVPNPGPIQKLRQQPSQLPLTDAGRKAVAAFKEASTANPASNCQPPTAPLLMIVPEVKQIEIASDKVTIRSQGFVADRVVSLGKPEASAHKPIQQGFSTGHWEGSRLVVDTVDFLPNRVGNAIGLPSGKGKHLVETFELNDSKTQLIYRFTLSDPEYLTQAVSDEQPWNYRPDLKYSQDACDLKNSRIYLK